MGRIKAHWEPGQWRGVEINPVKLYRDILRQVSILHDDVARAYFPKYVRSRFDDKQEIPEMKREIQALQEARHAVRMLERANDGHPRSLMKVMEMAYGRSGKRRHELLTVLPFSPFPPRGRPH